MCASTLCPLSSSTRNCVLGNASVTVPSTSMTSSLAKDLLFSNRYKMALKAKRICYHAGPSHHTSQARPLPVNLAVSGQHPRSVLGHGDGVLEVGRERAVGGVDRPTVPLADSDVVATQRDHGFNSEGHPGHEAWAGARTAVVWDLRVLVHLAPDPVGDQVPDDPVAATFGQVWYAWADSPELFPARACSVAASRHRRVVSSNLSVSW